MEGKEKEWRMGKRGTNPIIKYYLSRLITSDWHSIICFLVAGVMKRIKHVAH